MQTKLYEKQKLLGAKFISFAGFDLPLHYGSILNEHEAVRKGAALFDVSHMGRIEITGPDALVFLDSLSVNNLKIAEGGSSVYTLFCDERGGVIDDMLIYIESEHSAFLVANSTNRETVYNHLKEHQSRFLVSIDPLYEKEGILSLQGPDSYSLMKEWIIDLTPKHFAEIRYQDKFCIVSRTGYTGEDGFEFFAPFDLIEKLWDEIVLKRKATPAGLGARDILRLEMGYALYGHELSREINPIESVASWTVKLEGREFIGKKAIVDLQESGNIRHATALKGMSRALAREGCEVFKGDQRLGTVTSGTFSPSINAPIALALLDRKLNPGETLAIKIREEFHAFEVVKLPFYHKDIK